MKTLHLLKYICQHKKEEEPYLEMYLEIDDLIIDFAIQSTYTGLAMALHLKTDALNSVLLNKTK